MPANDVLMFLQLLLA